MPNLHELENAMPVAPLGIIALESMKETGQKINDYLVEFRSHDNNSFKNDQAFED